MTGYRMTDEEAQRDLGALRQLPPLLSPDLALEPWTATLAGIELRSGVNRRFDVGEVAAAMGQRPLLVTDHGMVEAGHCAAIQNSLKAANIEPVVVDTVGENPTTAYVEATAAGLAGEGIDCLIALGGGSVLDAAKGIHFMLTQGGRMVDYWGYGKTHALFLPSIALPATAGTGSEAQAYTVLSDPESGRKMACGDAGARYRVVLLDSELLATVPRGVAAAAALDALSHAVESLVSRAASETSKTLSVLAWRLLEPAVTPALSGDLAALARMALGAHLAGAAIEQSMLGATHAAANPLTALCGVRHGVAIGMLLPAVVRFNHSVAEADYQRLEGAVSANQLADRLAELGGTLDLPPRLTDLGVQAAQLPELAALATEEWTGSFNPRPVTAGDFEGFYRGIL